MKDRKRILIHSNSHFAFTGFGKNCKNILKYLHSTNKYELFELANGIIDNNQVDNLPWRVIGGVPNDQGLIERSKSDPLLSRSISYGVLSVDKAIQDVRPDVYIGIEDIWAFSDIVKKPWWNKLNCMIWTTLDSLPILPEAVNLAPKIKNYYVWSSFAEKSMKSMGINHVKTLHGSIDEKNFHKLSETERDGLRSKFNIPKDCFVIGFVFRNQLRKTVGDLITGFRIFKNKYPEQDAKLLLHTNWAEGWDIPRLLAENGVNSGDVLTTYHCSSCKNYHVHPFVGNSADCPFCGKKGSFSTTSVINGVSEVQLNEIYNLMDMYVHPFTSGGQEIPIQEAKLTELITAVTNYTCGEEMCSDESGGLPLSWSPYREIGTQFVKASTSPLDIANKIELVAGMSKAERSKMGEKARSYVINNYSFQAIGKKLEQIIDAMPKIDFDFSQVIPKPNPQYQPKLKYSSDIEFLKDLYRNILKIEVDINDNGLRHWIQRIRSGENPANVLKYFREVATKELSEKFPLKMEDIIGDNNDPKIALVIPPDSYVSLLVSYFIKSIKKLYPNHKLYIFSNDQTKQNIYPYYDMIEKICPFIDGCENQSYMEGIGNHKGFFDVCYILNKSELNSAVYSHNSMDIPQCT